MNYPEISGFITECHFFYVFMGFYFVMQQIVHPLLFNAMFAG